jgi:hypothetical protein
MARSDAPKPPTKAGVLAHNAAYTKSHVDRAKEAAEKPAELRLPRPPPPVDLPEVEMRPPIFLTQVEAMTDIYMKTRGRMSTKTKELLEGPDLEDLLKMIDTLHATDELMRKAEARLLHPIWSKLKDDPGPMLLGLNDPRLYEPWRLFLDRWDIWTPEDHEEKSGVELFWEGEAEDDDGNEIEILQALKYQQGELSLHAKLGDKEDRITFDGQAFYRLKSARPPEGGPKE